MFGTIGWIVAGLSVGFMGVEATAMPLRIAAAASLALALLAFGPAAHAARSRSAAR